MKEHFFFHGVRWGAAAVLALAVAGSGMVSYGREPEKDGVMLFETDRFSVQVPTQIAEISDIEATEDGGLAFYEKLSHGKYGGFVAEIALYDSVRDYAMIPHYARGGEFDLEDGSRLDVVLIYPSDVQFDIQNPESVDNYNLIGNAFRNEILDSLMAVGGTWVPQDQVDTTSIYDALLERFKADLEERKDQEGLMEDDFSYLYAYSYQGEDDPLTVNGYAFADINGDGYKELLLGRLNDPSVYDLFTQVDGEVYHVLSGGERDVYALIGHEEGGWMEIRNTASGGADLTRISFSLMEPGEDHLFEQVAFIYDGQSDPEHPYSISYAGNEPETVPEEEWNQRQSNFGEMFVPAYKPIGELG